MRNVATVLEKAQYGPLQNELLKADPQTIKQEINFTTLMIMMINYDHFSYTLEETIDIIRRIQKEFKLKE